MMLKLQQYQYIYNISTDISVQILSIKKQQNPQPVARRHAADVFGDMLGMFWIYVGDLLGMFRQMFLGGPQQQKK